MSVEREPTPEELTSFLAENGGLDKEEIDDISESNFSAGFKGETKDDDQPDELRKQESQESQENQETEKETVEVINQKPSNATKKSEKDPIRELYGRFGSVQSELKRAQERIKDLESKRGPSKEEILAAMDDDKKLEELREDEPAIAAAIDAHTRALNKQFEQKLAESRQGYISRNDLDQISNDIRQLAVLDTKYPQWQNDIAKPEFKEWLSSQPTEVQLLLDSNSINDELKFLDLYYSNRAGAAQANRSRNQQLKQAVTPRPKSVSTSPSPGEDAFSAGFRKTRGV